jgi:hypothetical protein
MNPFIFLFRESPRESGQDLSLLRYDPVKNLTIDPSTGKPAISVLNMATETFTKADGEMSDTDRSGEIVAMGTQTQTFADAEGGDSDQDTTVIRMLMGTSTETRTFLESSDQD